jgi:hypothetical protein
MELDELKTSWNALDKRLAETEIVNLRVVKEMIQQKTKSAYNGIVGQNLYFFVVNILIIGILFPYIYMNTPIRALSFAIVEAMMILGLIPIIWKLFLLSKFDMGGKSCNELSRLVLRYKQICHQQKYWEIAAVCLAMVAFYIIELGFNPTAGYVFEANRVLIVIGLTLLTFAMAFVLGLWQRRRHAQQMLEIERGLEELREFEN